jgi:3-oxoadipate enol-lactonase
VADLERDGAVEVAGRRLTWRALGAGPRLLLAQGYAGSADDWDPAFVEALGRSFSLVMPDNRGMGGSELGDPDEVTIDSMAADLEAVLDELAIESIPVVGFSMGGFIAQRLAARAPGRVERLALLSTDPGGPGAIRAAPADWGRLVDHSGTPRERASRTISVIFPPDVAPRFDREFGDLVAASQATLDPAALAAEERAMDEWWAAPPGDGVAPIASVLIAAGADDVVIPPGNAQLLAERFPGARVELFAGAGHAFMAQHPDAAADLIESQL